MNKKSYNIIDFGSSKIRFSIFDNALKEIYSATSRVVLDNEYTHHFNEIKKLIREAEKKISFHIDEIILIYDSKELLIIDVSLNKNIQGKIQINKLHNSLFLELKQIISTNYDNLDLVHIIIDKCIIDKKIYDHFPKELKKLNNIKIDFKLICYPKKNNLKIKEKFNNNNLNVLNIFSTTYSKTLLYTSKINSKNISFLEIGWEKTSLLIYQTNRLKFFYTIPIGSFHITKDISKIFKINIDEAEEIKKLFNSSEDEFSYQNNLHKNPIIMRHLMEKKISVTILKKVILSRVQEIINLKFIKSNIISYNINLEDHELFLIGDGSKLFHNNLFYLEDKFKFKSINFYEEKNFEICNSGLKYYLNNFEFPQIHRKNQGFFEKFFNIFSK